MAGIEDKVREFLASWPIIKDRLEEVLKDDEGLFHGDRACRSLRGQQQDDLSTPLGQADPGLSGR